jgi:hypothetical protein
MSTTKGGLNTVNNGLVLCLDATNSKSLISGSNVWYDVSRTQTTGSLINGPTYDPTNGGGVIFDGTNDNINVKSTTSTVYTSTTSWEFIAKPTLNAAYRPFFSLSDYTDALGFISLFFNPNTMMFRINVSDVAAATRTLDFYFGDSLTAAGIYTHVVLTYDGTVFRLYQNGRLLNTSTSWTYGLGTNTKSQILGYFWGGYWTGNINLFRQYNKTLSLAEVQQNFNTIRSRFGI